MRFSLRLRLIALALLPFATATACLGGEPTQPVGTALAEAAAQTATALAVASAPTLLPSAPPPPASATVASSPTSLPSETAAGEPSATPSPIAIEPTATLNVPATPDPNEAVGDVVYQDPLDGASTWFWTFQDDVAVFGIDPQRQQLKGVMTQTGQGWRFTVSPDTLRIGNQQVRVTTHTAACAENDEFGLMFRGSVDAEFHYSMYVFKVRCGGAARFEFVRGTETTVLTDWSPLPAAPLAADNTLMVWAAGDEFRFYLNDQYLFTAFDSTLTEGFYGLYLYDRTAGGATVYYEDLVARAVNR